MCGCRQRLPNPQGLLRPGMFVNTEVPLASTTSHIVVPATAIQFAPYGDMVYIVDDIKGPDGKTFRGVRQQVVKVGESRGDRVAILSGVNAGEEVVTSGVFKLRPGVPVQVNNSIQPENSELPKPEDT